VPPVPATQLAYAKEIRQFLRAPATEIGEFFVVLVGCLVIAAQTLHDDPMLTMVLNEAEDTISLLFVAEYCARWYSKGLKPTFVLEPQSVIDFLSFLPFLLREMGLGSFPGFTFLRLLRIFRLRRYLKDVETFERLIGGVIPGAKSIRPYQLEVCH